MFWRFGGYATVSTIDTLLEKPDVTLEELLDESDLIQELKSHNTKLIEYLREDVVLEALLEYVIAPKLEATVVEDVSGEPDEEEKGKSKEAPVAQSINVPEGEEDEREKKRNKYAFVSAEILSSDSWSLSASLSENPDLLRIFWGFLKRPAPLDPLQASYFTKVNETLLDKKTEEMLEIFKSLDNIVDDMLRHVDSPQVMDLLLKIISLDKAEGGAGIVDWLHAQDMMPTLLSFLSAEHSWATQTSAGDFLKAIITISANASQNEQSCIGPNELTRQLVSYNCVEKLIKDMLKGGNPLTVGVGIVIEVIRKNNSDYDPDVGTEANTIPSSRDPIYLGTLLRMFASHVPDFMQLILSPNHTVGGGNGPVTIKRQELRAAFGNKIEPLGFDRFKTCELMAELLHCSNMGLLNEVGSDEFVRARDTERDRLRAEGKLGLVDSEPRDSTTEDLTMKSSTNTRFSDSIDEVRRLEVQNSSDDDGFEEVTVSGVLGEEAKDDFDEKPDMMDDMLTPTQLNSSLSFLDQDSEEFVDEPLSSPRLKPADDDVVNVDRHEAVPEIPALTPLSPTSAVAEKVGILSVGEDHDTPMTSPPPSEHDASAEDVVISLSTDLENHLKEVEPQSNVLLSPSALETETIHIHAPRDGISPHPEDTPAPLFAKKTEEPASLKNLESPPDADDSNTSTPKSGETNDTTMADAGDEPRPTLTTGSEEQSGISVNDSQDQQPVVGDYLKMQFVEHKVVPTILDFFFRFPWNNFLHNVVYDVVQQVFNGPMDRGYNRNLAIDLFDTGDITMRIVDGQKKSDEAQEKNKMRLGYMGHLTLIAEEVVKFTERHPPELLSGSVLEKVMNGEWSTYVEVTLTETRERDNAILGGVRPDMNNGQRQVMNAVNVNSGFVTGSSALADAGLNGTGLDSMDLSNGNGLTSAGFSITGGSLLSGFGSSSDEEDEEMDEDHEEDGGRNAGAEFSRYITSSSTTTATSTSPLEPPLIPPPPPPPLNIPPSRARRQLAARLALHKLNAENSTSNGEQATHRKNLNPFATEEDDDEEEPDDSEFGGLGLRTGSTGMDDLVLGDLGALEHSSDSSSSDEDEQGGFGAGVGGKKRRPSTTEAKRRTSLEDDDEEFGELESSSSGHQIEQAEHADKEKGEKSGHTTEHEMQGVEGDVGSQTTHELEHVQVGGSGFA